MTGVIIALGLIIWALVRIDDLEKKIKEMEHRNR